MKKIMTNSFANMLKTTVATHCIAMCCIVFFSVGCTLSTEGGPLAQRYMIWCEFKDRPRSLPWPDKDSVVHVKMNIDSEFTDNAFLVVYSSWKIHRPCTRYRIVDRTTNEPILDSIASQSVESREGTKDNLKIDGFHIRTYAIPHELFYIEGITTPTDYPVYFKEISLKKGKNKEDFKIVFPRNIASIPGRIHITVGIGRFNDEIKRRFEENFPGDFELTDRDKSYQDLYFKNFPDSSKTSMVFSNIHFLDEILFFPEDPSKFAGKRYFWYYNIILNGYNGAPRVECEEYIIYR